MAKEEMIEFEGVVLELLPEGRCRVKLAGKILQAQTRIKNGTIDDVFNENDSSFPRRVPDNAGRRALGIARQRWIDTPAPVTDAGPAESFALPVRNDVSRARKSSIM